MKTFEEINFWANEPDPTDEELERQYQDWLARGGWADYNAAEAGEPW